METFEIKLTDKSLINFPEPSKCWLVSYCQQIDIRNRKFYNNGIGCLSKEFVHRLN